MITIAPTLALVLAACWPQSQGRGRDELPALAEACSEGLVRWHGSREAALAAARESGRPVMLFQMLGRLDEEFC